MSVKPRLVVMDFAPALRLALDRSIPTIVVGNGYSVPPAGRPLPPLRPWRQTVPALSRAHEALILEKLNRNRASANARAVDFVADVFQGMETFVCTIDAFDPYRAYRRPGSVSPPVNLPDIQPGPPVPQRSGGVFAYLPSDHPALDILLEAFNAIAAPTEVYFGNRLPPRALARLSARVRIRSEPADYAASLPQTKLLIHHGGLATTYAGLMAGAPQLILPLGLEHLITARAAERLGPAKTISAAETTLERIMSDIRFLLESPLVHAEAVTTSATFHQRRNLDPLQIIAETCGRFLRQPPKE